MSFGLTGASGSGKTTLAKEIAEKMNIPYHDASITRIMKANGLDPVGPTAPLDERIAAQEKLLDQFIAEIRSLDRPFISDRTPIDMIGYMLGEITMRNSTQEQGERAFAYAAKCLNTTRELFDAVLVLRPLPFYENTETRPPQNAAYQFETQLIMEGALSLAIENDEVPFCYAQMFTPNRELRLEKALEFFNDRIQHWKDLSKQVVVH